MTADEKDEPPIFHIMPVLPPSWFLTFVPGATVTNAEDKRTWAESTQYTEQEQQLMMMCTAETDYSHSSYMCTAAHSRNLTDYLIRNSHAATDQETSDIMILLQKLDELETSAEKEQIFK